MSTDHHLFPDFNALIRTLEQMQMQLKVEEECNRLIEILPHLGCVSYKNFIEIRI